jgi:hypothetical protein
MKMWLLPSKITTIIIIFGPMIYTELAGRLQYRKGNPPIVHVHTICKPIIISIYHEICGFLHQAVFAKKRV